MKLATITKKEAYSVMMSAIYAMDSEDKRYAILGDLVMALDDESFINFLSLFEGQTIDIPSMAEITKMLTSMAMYTKYHVERMPLDEMLKEMNITRDSPQYTEFRKFCRIANRAYKQLQIGGALSEFPSSKAQVIE